MLPLVDRPALDFIIQEFMDAGIEEVLLISSRRKGSMEAWFHPDEELDHVLLRDGKAEAYAKARPPKHSCTDCPSKANAWHRRCLDAGREFAGDAPVVVAFPDDLFGAPNCSQQLIETWRTTGKSVLVWATSRVEMSRYGVVDGVMRDATIHVREVVEKPEKGTEPSHWVSLGDIYTPRTFGPLAALHAEHVGEGEFYPMGAMNQLASAGKMAAGLWMHLGLIRGSPWATSKRWCHLS